MTLPLTETFYSAGKSYFPSEPCQRKQHVLDWGCAVMVVVLEVAMKAVPSKQGKIASEQHGSMGFAALWVRNMKKKGSSWEGGRTGRRCEFHILQTFHRRVLGLFLWKLVERNLFSISILYVCATNGFLFRISHDASHLS